MRSATGKLDGPVLLTQQRVRPPIPHGTTGPRVGSIRACCGNVMPRLGTAASARSTPHRVAAAWAAAGPFSAAAALGGRRSAGRRRRGRRCRNLRGLGLLLGRLRLHLRIGGRATMRRSSAVTGGESEAGKDGERNGHRPNHIHLPFSDAEQQQQQKSNVPCRMRFRRILTLGRALLTTAECLRIISGLSRAWSRRSAVGS